jgi:hypothetical protein
VPVERLRRRARDDHQGKAWLDGKTSVACSLIPHLECDQTSK